MIRMLLYVLDIELVHLYNSHYKYPQIVHEVQVFLFFLRRSDDRFRESVNNIFVTNQLYVKCLTEYIENSVVATAELSRSFIPTGKFKSHIHIS